MIYFHYSELGVVCLHQHTKHAELRAFVSWRNVKEVVRRRNIGESVARIGGEAENGAWERGSRHLDGAGVAS